jgi:hypothetical protein
MQKLCKTVNTRWSQLFAICSYGARPAHLWHLWRLEEWESWEQQYPSPMPLVLKFYQSAASPAPLRAIIPGFIPSHGWPAPFA